MTCDAVEKLLDRLERLIEFQARDCQLRAVRHLVEYASDLEEKLPGWRVKAGLQRYIRAGYLSEDEQGNLYLDWRTWAEVDQKALMDLLLKYGE